MVPHPSRHFLSGQYQVSRICLTIATSPSESLYIQGTNDVCQFTAVQGRARAKRVNEGLVKSLRVLCVLCASAVKEIFSNS
jgi:hypothetical protein